MDRRLKCLTPQLRSKPVHLKNNYHSLVFIQNSTLLMTPFVLHRLNKLYLHKNKMLTSKMPPPGQLSNTILHHPGTFDSCLEVDIADDYQDHQMIRSIRIIRMMIPWHLGNFNSHRIFKSNQYRVSPTLRALINNPISIPAGVLPNSERKALPADIFCKGSWDHARCVFHWLGCFWTSTTMSLGRPLL